MPPDEPPPATLEAIATSLHGFHEHFSSYAQEQLQGTREVLRLLHNQQIQITWLTRERFQFLEYEGARDPVMRSAWRMQSRGLLHGLPPFPTPPPMEPLEPPPTYH